MNDLLDYLVDVCEELKELHESLLCDALESECENISSIYQGLKEKIKYYQGFGSKEDKVKKAYFEVELDDEEMIDDFFTNPETFDWPACKFKRIKKEDIKD